ncbi:hypothetical protein RHS01_05782 [Rhizoctonia solani]|uniref:Uncharacterized protein n=1 Tax=Rhizoctonia solani TaxID=456999 RepID=A0A8H7IB80_9AGAM|nr:hypothetical protein RHS01_05782 [Rhizoctonia solani]
MEKYNSSTPDCGSQTPTWAENPVCNGLSWMWQYQEDSEEGNGQEETVDPDWEAHKGLLVEVQYVMEDTEAGETLRRAADGEDLTPANIKRAQKRAAHRAVGFEVAEGKLWRVAGKGRLEHHK